MAVGNSDHCPLIKQGENMKNRLFTLITALSLGLSVFAGTDMIVKQKNGEEVRFFVEDVEEVFFSDSVPEEVPVVDESETFLEFNILSDSTAEVKEETTIYTGSYKGHSSIVIPAKIRIDGKVYDVVALGDRVFSHNYDLTKITIPSSIVSIGKYAFNNCLNLVNIELPESVLFIGDGAFYSCKKITKFKIPSKVTTIGEETFGYCAKLTSVDLPLGITSIGKLAFSDCERLSTIEIPSSVKNIGNGAFEYCQSLDVVIDNSKDNVVVGEGAFNSCKSVTWKE